MAAKNLVCDICNKPGFKSPHALKSHKNAVHPEQQAIENSDVLNLTLQMPNLGVGTHQVNCPICNTPTMLTINEEGNLERRSSAKPSSSDGKPRTENPFTIAEHPVIIKERMKQRQGKKTVVMMGTHGRSGPLAPWDESGIDEWWGLNDSASIFKDHMDIFDRWFQMHHRWRFTRRNTRYSEDHWRWLQETAVPRVYMQRKYTDVPNSVKFPLREVCEELIGNTLPRGAGYVTQYFASTFSYMLALVIYEKLHKINNWERVEIYGCELEQIETEYFRQRPGMEWWLGMCSAHGIEVYFPHDTFIAYTQDITNQGLKNYPGYMIYGYDSPSKAEALAANQPLGEDPVEENLVGAWEDYYPNFIKSANKGVYEMMVNSNGLDGLEVVNPLLNEFLGEVLVNGGK